MPMQVINKPWGREEIIELNERYVVKKITLLKGHRCSLQYHKIKQETIYIVSGKLKISSGPNVLELDKRVLYPNEFVTLEPGVIHRMESLEDSIYLESSTPELEDVVRIEDDYQRVD